MKKDFDGFEDFIEESKILLENIDKQMKELRGGFKDLNNRCDRLIEYNQKFEVFDTEKTEGYLISLTSNYEMESFQDSLLEVVGNVEYSLRAIPDPEYGEKDFELIVSAESGKIKQIDDFLEKNELVETYEKGWKPL